MKAPRMQFDKNFMWGAGVSAHQVEGGLHNQWTVWELENAHSLAAQAPYQYGDLDNWSSIAASAKRPANYVSGRASDHAHRYMDDFDLLQSMNLNTFRFSIEWSRLEPHEGQWDSAAVDFYRKYISELHRRRVRPIVTLFHFTLPVWFSERGGFALRRNVKCFERFVEKVMDEFGPQLADIITINEPTIYAAQSYLEGNWPPNVRSRWQSWRVLENMLLAHRRAAKIIHARGSKYQVSLAHHVSYIYAGDDAWLSQASAAIFDWFQNHYAIRRTIKSCDFIGVNYYNSDRIYGYRKHNPNSRVSDIGWDMQPANLRYVLEELAERYKKPLIVTENGLADADDTNRGWWLQETIQALWQARQNGADVRGYIHWSLLDNVEWDKGRWPRFGLVAVNYRTFERTLRPSAKALSRAIAAVQKGK